MFSRLIRPESLLSQRTSKTLLVGLMSGFIQVVFAVAPVFVPSAHAVSQSFSWSSSGPQTFTVPQGVTSISITMTGGEGGWGGTDGNNGGKPSYVGQVTGTISGLTPGQTITIAVGGGGNNGDGCVGSATGNGTRAYPGSGIGGINDFNGPFDTTTGIFNGGTGGEAGEAGCSGAGGGGGAATVVVLSGGQEIVAGGGGGGGGGNAVRLFNEETGFPNASLPSTTSFVTSQSFGASGATLASDGGGNGGGGGGWFGGAVHAQTQVSGTEYTGWGGYAGANRIPSGYSGLNTSYVPSTMQLNYALCHQLQAHTYNSGESNYTGGGNTIPGNVNTSNAGCGSDGAVTISYAPSVSIYQTDSNTVYESATAGATGETISGTNGTSPSTVPNGTFQSVNVSGLAKGNYLGYATDTNGTSAASSNSVTIGTACGSQSFTGNYINLSAANTNYGGGNPGYCNLQFLAGSGTWTVPSGVNALHAVVVGGGGGGAENNGGGGSGGQVVDSVTYSVTPTNGISLSVGNGGSGGATPGNNATNGSSGTSSTFGTLTASGGNPGLSAAAAAGASVNTGSNAGAGAGGHGSVTNGGSATAGTNGVTVSLAGNNVTLGGGGGGGTWNSSSTSLRGGSGGTGGGGTGATQIETSTPYACVPGSSQTCPGTSAWSIKQLTGTNTNGLYWVTVNGTATQVYAIMDSTVDGGGWMLAMKGANGGSSFTYDASYWTDTTTLIPSAEASTGPGPIETKTAMPAFTNNSIATQATPDNADAKYNVFNYAASNQFLALFPDETNTLGGKFTASSYPYGYTWEDYDTGTVKFGGTGAPTNYVQPFQSATVDLSKITPSVGSGCGFGPSTLQTIFSSTQNCLIRQVKPTYDASEPGYSVIGNHVFASEPNINFYGFNHNPGPKSSTVLTNAAVRLGVGFNENNNYPCNVGGSIAVYCDDYSDDVQGGIGMRSTNYEAGNWDSCCESGGQTSSQTSMAFELYVRNTSEAITAVNNFAGNAGVPGLPNTGGGGGGGAAYAGYGGNGGSGTVYLTYIIPPTHTAPKTDTTTAGLTYTFTDSGTAASGLTRSYIWQKSTDTGTTWSTLQTGSSASYTTPVLDTSTSGSRYQYRVIVTDTDTNNDQSSDTSTTFYLNINPKIALTQNQYPVSTYGSAAVDSYTATYGTGTKTFTYTSPTSSKITVDSTTSLTTSTINFRIDSATPVGTYYETITATDSVSATTSETITMTVNKAPSFLVTETHTVGTYYYTGLPLVDTPTFYTTGMVNNETVSVSSYSWSGTSYAGISYSSTSPPTSAGQYRATPQTISLGAFANNYVGDTPTAGDTVTINRRARTVTISAGSTSLKYGDTTTLSVVETATGVTDSAATIQADGSIQYSSNTPSTCSITGNTLQIISNAACSVYATAFRGNNYETATSATLNITVSPALAPIDAVTSNTVTFGSTFTETASVTGLVYTDTYSAQTFTYQGTPIPANTCANGGYCNLGDTGPGGGVVIYDAGSNQTWGRYIEMAPQGWANGLTLNSPVAGEVAGTSTTDPQVRLCDTGSGNLPAANPVSVGTGYAGTQAFLAFGCNANAESLLYQYTGNGKTDWVIPDLGTVAAIAGEPSNVTSKLGFPSSATFIWTTSQYSSVMAQLYTASPLGGNSQFWPPTSPSIYLRPVRYFWPGPYSTTPPTQVGTYEILGSNLTLGNSRPLSNYSFVRYQIGTLTINRAPRGTLSIGPTPNGTFTGIIGETNTLYVINATPFGGVSDTITDTFTLVSSSGASDRVCSVTTDGRVYATGSSQVTCVVNVVVAQAANYLAGQDTATIIFNPLLQFYPVQTYSGNNALNLQNNGPAFNVVAPVTASDSSTTSVTPSIIGFTTSGNDTTGVTVTITGSAFWSPVSNDLVEFFFHPDISLAGLYSVNTSATPQTMTINFPAGWFAGKGYTSTNDLGRIAIETPSGWAMTPATFVVP